MRKFTLGKGYAPKNPAYSPTTISDDESDTIAMPEEGEEEEKKSNAESARSQSTIRTTQQFIPAIDIPEERKGAAWVDSDDAKPSCVKTQQFFQPTVERQSNAQSENTRVTTTNAAPQRPWVWGDGIEPSAEAIKESDARAARGAQPGKMIPVLIFDPPFPQ